LGIQNEAQDNVRKLLIIGRKYSKRKKLDIWDPSLQLLQKSPKDNESNHIVFQFSAYPETNGEYIK
jgi:hypothetical protein